MTVAVKSTETSKAQPAKGFTLPNEKVRVDFIMKQRGNIVNKRHVLFGGMSDNAKRRLVPVRSKSTFQYERVLTDAEEAYLEKKLSLGEGGLSVYAIDNNYWDRVTIDLVKEGITLDLSDPMDYIKYKVVLSYSDIVAPSLATLKVANLFTYMFVIIRQGEKASLSVDSYNIKKEAYLIAAKLETNLSSVKEFLFLCGVKASPNSSATWLKSKLGELVEENPSKVIDIYTAADYTTRALVAKGVLAGVIHDTNGKYTLEGGVALAEEGEMPTLGNAIKFLSNKANADVKSIIEAKIG